MRYRYTITTSSNSGEHLSAADDINRRLHETGTACDMRAVAREISNCAPHIRDRLLIEEAEAWR